MTPNAHLSQDQRGVLSDLLKLRLGELMAERTSQQEGLSRVESAHQILLQDADDAAQRAGAHEVEGTLADINSEQIESISDALRRVHGADYGLCLDCRNPISFARLSAEPQTLRCLDCETNHERKAPS